MTMKAALCASLSAACLLAACATPGPKEALEPITADLTSWASLTEDRGPAPVTSDWLTALNDPAVTEVVTDALRNNFDLQASRERVSAARQRARITRADLLPTVGASNVAFREGRPISGGVLVGGQVIGAGGGLSGDVWSTNYTLGADLNWELDIWGRLTDQTRADYFDAAAQNLDFAAARLSVAGSAAQAHYALTAARMQQDLARRDVETGEANLRIIERRYNRGISTSLDLRLARSSLASSRAQFELRRQQQLEAARRLETLLGRYPAGTVTAPDELADPAPLEGGGFFGAGSPEELLDRRPDIVAAERRMKAAGLRVSAARKAFLPALSIRASLQERAFAQSPVTDGAGNVIQLSDNADFSDLFDIDNMIKQLIGNLAQPIFQGGRLIANERAAKNEARALLYDYATTTLAAWEEVENALTNERLFTLREQALEEAYEEATAAEELTERRYLAGTTNIFDLIDAQQRRIQSESQWIEARNARLTNRIDLYLALGAPYIIEDEAADDLASAPAGEGEAS